MSCLYNHAWSACGASKVFVPGRTCRCATCRRAKRSCGSEAASGTVRSGMRARPITPWARTGTPHFGIDLREQTMVVGLQRRWHSGCCAHALQFLLKRFAFLVHRHAPLARILQLLLDQVVLRDVVCPGRRARLPPPPPRGAPATIARPSAHAFVSLSDSVATTEGRHAHAGRTLCAAPRSGRADCSSFAGTRGRAPRRRLQRWRPQRRSRGLPNA